MNGRLVPYKATGRASALGRDRSRRDMMVRHLLACSYAASFFCPILRSQVQPKPISASLSRIEGTDPENQVTYVRIFLSGTTASSELKPPPTLTAQCTQQPHGKLAFELFVNFGGISDYDYHRPWLPKDGGLFPPSTQKVLVVMQFLGYTRVKPVKRQWELVLQPDGQLRYNPPSFGSANMEEIAFYLQYLKALPTLRLTWEKSSADFLTTPLLDQLRKEPLCRAAGL